MNERVRFTKWLCCLLVAVTIISISSADAIPLDQGPGGPILIVTSSTNPFTKYYAEILRAEGLNSFAVIDISQLSAAALGAYDVVVLGQVTLTTDQVTMFNNYVASGGNLITMRPDAKLAGLLGLTSSSLTLSDKYLRIDNSMAPGRGLVNQTIQFHGAADVYTLSGATPFATLYSDAGTATSYPAVTWRGVGAFGGQVVSFTFDLAKSIVYTRQGNPAWQKQLRDPNTGCVASGAQPCVTGSQVPPIRGYDLFYGNASFDPQPDWIDLNKVAIPQADEQQRLLANLIVLMNVHRKPIPRFWYFPRGYKAVVVMTGDDHANGGTVGRFESYKSASTPGCSVVNWECIRSTSYIYPSPLMTDAQAAAYTAAGFEVALHIHTNCGNWTTQASLDSFFSSEYFAFRSSYPSQFPATNRTHCAVWSDYSSHPLVELNYGMRLDTTYYYYPGSWILDRPGLFTGSGMPMRYAAADGTMIDVYQAVTQLTDESKITYSAHISSLLDKATGAEGYYGAFTANMHTDFPTSAGSDAIVGAALLRKIPVVSSRQMLTWIDGRNNSYFGALGWANNTLSFTIAAGAGADGLQGMLPVTSIVGPLVSMTFNGSPVSFTKQTIKGIQYAVFSAVAGNYTAAYTYDATPPDTVITSAPAALSNKTTATFTFISTKADGTFACSLDSSSFTACASPQNYLGLSGGAHAFLVRASDLLGNTDPTPAAYNWTVGSLALSSFTDTTVADFGGGSSVSGYIAQTTDGEITLAPAAGSEFIGSTLPSGWFSTVYSGGTLSLSNSVATLNGSLIGTNGLYGPGRSLEFVATFSGEANQHIGFGVDLSGAPWVLFGTWNGGGLYARTSNGVTATNTLLATNWLGASHRFRIDWNAGNVDFFVDGSLVAAHTVSIATSMRPIAVDAIVYGGSPSLSLDWIRMSPYASSGTYLSRVFDAGTSSTWGTASWTSTIPAATTLQMSVRLGNTPAPDGAWTSFANLLSSGAAIPGSSRYLQYSAQLSTTDPTLTPILNDVTITYVAGGADTTPPTTTITSTPATSTTSTTASFSFTSSKINSTFGCSLDGSSYVACTSAQSYSGLAVTSHTFRVRATDSNGITDPAPPSFTWTITASSGPPPPSPPPSSAFSDSTFADFSAGAPDAGIFVGKNGLNLAAAVGTDFLGSTLPAGWFSTPYAAGGNTSISGGTANVDGALVGTNTSYGPGRSLEFVANFNGAPYQHAGFGVDLNSQPWAIFGTYYGGALFARTQNGVGVINTAISGNWLGTFHRYRIDWSASSVVYSIDGAVVASHAVSITAAMRPVIADYYVDGKVIGMTSLRMTPYATAGTFLSRVFDATGTATWSPSWASSTPAGTALQLSVRLGNSTTPDGTWTGFTPVTTPGTAISGSSRYLQYRAVLTSTDSNQTPALSSFSLNVTLTGSGGSPPPPSGPSFTDSTFSNFSGGTPDAGIYISNAGASLAPTISTDFSGSALPAGWFITPYAAGGSVSFSPAGANVDGALVGMNASVGPGRSLDFVANFNGAAYQHAGFGVDLNSQPWAIFGTWYGGALFARTQNAVSAVNTLIPGNWLGTAHRYHIDWNATSVVYSIDGAIVATHPVAISAAMRPVITDYYVDGKVIAVTGLRMSPYTTSSGTFLSRVIDTGTTMTWNSASWTSSTPAGTTLAIVVRLGNTPGPDSTWTAFTPVAGSGAAVSGTSRYLQYRAVLTSSDPMQSPALNSITFK